MPGKRGFAALWEKDPKRAAELCAKGGRASSGGGRPPGVPNKPK
jgi:general stress protein YciG